MLAGSIFWPVVQQVEAGETGEKPLEVTHSQNTNTVPLYEVFEITFKHERRYENPFFDVIIEVTFTAPSGRQVRVGGFHYGSGAKPEIRTFKTRSPGGARRRVEYFFEKQNLWKARFAPSEPVRGLRLTLDVPAPAKGYWYCPETAAILEIVDAPAGKQTFTVPEFTVDLAFLVTPDCAPDIDKDGKPNHLDEDDDNDGVVDKLDAFPWNPRERRDTDGDGVGDNSDSDDDGDGWSDQEELRAGTDPLDKLSFPLE